MSSQTRLRPDTEPPTAGPPAPDTGPAETSSETPTSTGDRIPTVCAAGGIAAVAALWMTAGVFEGWFARGLGVLSPLLGAGLVAASYRVARPASVQYAAVPVAVAIGALVLAPSAALGEIPGLVSDALFSGGIGQPPVPFDPGWRFLFVVVGLLLGAVAAAVGVGFDRPKLAVAVPLPLLVGGALVQPAGAEVVSTTVGLVAMVGALSIAYGVELARTGATSGGFEARRLVRAALGALGLAGAVVALANLATFLLPASAEDRVVPPQRPQAAPPPEDRELFTVDLERALPWRLGVLDVYQDGAWMLPPFDPSRLVDVPAGGDLPTAAGATDLTGTVQLHSIDGRSVPVLGGAQSVRDASADLTYDPRTGTLRLPELAQPDTTYTVVATAPADAQALLAAGPVSDEVRPFLDVPPPPPEVAALLAEAPAAPAFERLQFVRQRYYEAVVATGPGDPVDVPPERVGELLAGAPGSPYEISAGEALLARWAGTPARIGFGYHAGDRVEGGRSFRPRHGATWLEVWFEGSGWVPIVGKPPRAQASLSDAPRNPDAAVRPADEFALVTYVPVRRENLTLLFEVVRYWLVRVVPVAGLTALLVALVPAGLRQLRRWRRERWARRRGPAARVAAAYADLREAAWDLNIGHPTRTPLEFVDDLADDDEHRELAWLVTRSLWGDLSRDLGDLDATRCEEMSASVTRRMRSAQPAFTRAVALASWASLRESFSEELPGPFTRTPGRGRPPRRLQPRLTTAGLIATLTLLALTTGSCTQPLELGAAGSAISPLPGRLAPTQLDDLALQREPAAERPFAVADDDTLVDHGQVFTVRRGDTIEASLQIVALRPGLEDRDEEVRDGLRRSLGGGRFEPRRIGTDRVEVLDTAERRLVLWFSPDGRWYQMLVARRAFEEAEDVFGALLAHQRGDDVTTLDTRTRARRLDPQRGIPG